MLPDITLNEFEPVSKAVTEEHHISQPRFPVLDIHTHMGKLLMGDAYPDAYDTDEFVRHMRSVGVKKFCNMDGVWGDEFDKMQNKTKGYEDEIFHFCWVDWESVDDPDFREKTEARIRECVRKGARGIKMWKVVSLVYKDKNGHYLKTDEERFDFIFDLAAELDIPVLIHIADPVAFFDPIDRFNERYEQLGLHPDWSFCAPDLYSFGELMEMQDNMIARHPKTTFIVAHFGSYAENPRHVAERLDRFPNMYVDIAQRVAELGRLPYTSREIFMKYADRILFGTDTYPHWLGEHEVAYRFLETMDEYFPYEPVGKRPEFGRWRIYGIGLPDDKLKKIYHENAMRLLKIDKL